MIRLIGKEKIHWSQTEILCYDCNDHSMIFRKEIEGRYIDVYKKLVAKYIRDKYSPLFNIDNKGSIWIKLNPEGF